MRQLLALIAMCLAGCGLAVQAPDLFLLMRSGAGGSLRLLVSDDGTIRCNGGKAKQLSNQLLLRARTLAEDLDPDAKSKLRINAGASSVERYTIKLKNGTVSFPDTAAAMHRELAEAELFATQAATGVCGLRS